MEKHTCSEKVYRSSRVMRSDHCRLPAKYEEGGQWYCNTHAPSKIKERHDAKAAEWKREQETTEGIRQRATARQLAVLRALNGEEATLTGWDVDVQTRRDPFGYTGNLVLSPKAVNQLLIKLGIDPRTVTP